MSSAVESVVRFLEVLRDDHARRFPGVRAPKVLGWMGTTGRAGSQAAVSLHRVRGVAAGASPGALEVELSGRLARPPGPGECVSVHLVRVEQYRGFQVKTRPLEPPFATEALLHATAGGLTVHGERLYTVHHSPYTLRFFDEVPFAEVHDLAAGLAFALCAVGPSANLSPRFVFHHEVRDGRLSLFHGDGLALKTALNLRANPRETRVLLDLADPGGWQLRGTVEPIEERDHPVAFDKVTAGFASGGWGRPSRVFRFTAEAMEPLAMAPAGPPG